MQSKDKLALLGILESINKISEYTKNINSREDFISNNITVDACLINLVNIGEMVYKLSDDFIEKYHEIKWHKIRGLLNIIAHDYFGVDLDEIWAVIQIHLPELQDSIVNLL